MCVRHRERQKEMEREEGGGAEGGEGKVVGRVGGQTLETTQNSVPVCTGEVRNPVWKPQRGKRRGEEPLGTEKKSK